MADIKNNADKISELELKKSQLENRIKELKRKEKDKEHKERTRRLIQNGALAEKYFNCEDIEPDKFEDFLCKLVNLDSVKNLIQKK